MRWLEQKLRAVAALLRRPAQGARARLARWRSPGRAGRRAAA